MTPVASAILVLGFSGIVAQVLLLRELLVTFNSNELTIGIILANWLILESAGSFLAGRVVEGVRRRREGFAAVTLLFALALPAAVFLARGSRDLLGAAPGEALGLAQAFWASLAVLLSVSFCHGALFTMACKLTSDAGGDRAAGIGRTYFLETVGTIAGGAVFTWLLVTRLNSFQVALAVSLVNALACLWLLSAPGEGRGRAPWMAAAAAAAVLLVVALAGPYAGRMQRESVRRQWPDQEVLAYRNSIYGNVAVTRRAGQFTVFTDGLPAVTAPTPDVAAAEDFAHLALLFHPAPSRVAVLSGGAGGLLDRVLDHPVERVDYAELDPLVLAMLREFPTPLTEGELGDPRVRVHHVDGRVLVARSGEASWDAILLGITQPQDLQTNRLFSREFFALAASRLAPGGILALRLPGSLTYLGPELRDLNAVVRNTLQDVFTRVRVIPGDGLNLFLASTGADLGTAGPDLLAARMRERQLPARFVSPGYLRYRLDPDRAAWFDAALAGADPGVNRDFEPLGVYHSLSHWNARFSPRFQKVFGRLRGFHPAWAAAGLGVVLFLPAVLLGRSRGTRRPGVVLAVATTGTAGMVFDLVLIFAFQALYGYVFFWVGILVTAFMAGTALGSLAMTRALARLRRGTRVLLTVEGGLALFSLVLPAVFLVMTSGGGETPPGARWIILLLAGVAGALIGLEFPLANAIYLGREGSVGRTVGLLYGADLMGGWLGGILGGVILAPVAGLTATCLVVAFFKALGLAAVALGSKNGVRHHFPAAAGR